jgi:hypothetical protein
LVPAAAFFFAVVTRFVLMVAVLARWARAFVVVVVFFVRGAAAVRAVLAFFAAGFLVVAFFTAVLLAAGARLAVAGFLRVAALVGLRSSLVVAADCSCWFAIPGASDVESARVGLSAAI